MDIGEKEYASKIITANGKEKVVSEDASFQALSPVYCFVSWPSPWEPCVTLVESALDLA